VKPRFTKAAVFGSSSLNRATKRSRVRPLFLTRHRRTQLALAALDAHDPHPLEIAPVHEPKRRLDEFPQKRLIEFGYHPCPIGVVGYRLDPLEELLHHPRPDIRHPLLRVPVPHFLKIAERGSRIADSAKLMTIGGTALFQPKSCLNFV